MLDLIDLAVRPPADAAASIADQLAAGGKITRKQLNAAMTEALGGTDAEGYWTQRDSFEALERALSLYLQRRPYPLMQFSDVLQTVELMQRLPTQTVRSEEQLQFQQFSTPADIGAIAVLMAAIEPSDIVLEPSAGNGLLVAQASECAELQLNEIDPIRRAGLARSFPGATITGDDGAMLVTQHATLARPSVVLMNPPFSRSLGRGADDLAAARHLMAALRRVRAGGRVVAIMPDWFTNSARMREAYAKVLAGATVQASLRFESCYRKHGTDVAVRLYVIDKVPEKVEAVTIQRSSVAEFLDVLAVPARAKLKEEAARTPIAVVRPSLFGASRTARPAAVRKVEVAKPNAVLPVTYRQLQEPAPLGEQVGIYLPYRPSRIVFDTAGEHPTPLVESVAMASIAMPIPNHVPLLPQRIVEERRLSSSQLETVVYAGHAWGHYLPGKCKPAKNGVALVLDEEGRQYRMGFFLGDGTGAGKGRQGAACILDQWLRGIRRHIWVTKNEPLLEDARRDWTALGGLSGDVQPISNWKIDEKISLPEGVLFVTYPTLRSSRSEADRLSQILEWAGEDFDGVILFDEAHEMGGVAGGEGALGPKAGSQQGICGVLLQNHLPDARVLYASATGASDINNLAYAVRLGLWGPETAFATREEFIASIRLGGIAAMELVARDLKALGIYIARALSFAGVEYEVLRHSLTPAQIEIYDTYSKAWSVIHRNMEHALEATNVVDGFRGGTLNSGAMAAARSRFESSKQRFFGQVLLSMKMPSVIPETERHLAEGQSVVFQLVTTAEALLDRRLAQMTAEERADITLDLSPTQICVDYLNRAFPTAQMEEYSDANGNAFSRPMYDGDGNPVHNPVAIAARDNLIEHICALPPIKTGLDALIDHFGTDRVAEVTGRTKRLVTTSDGRQLVETRSARMNQVEAAAFMERRKRILLFSDAGGTGRSYHASLEAVNQEQRVHFLLEPGWRADRAIQGLGRTHRTHQANTPLFRPVTTDCKGELRFTSTIARRLDTLGALTRGQRQTGGQNLFDPKDNLESQYAKDALNTWFRLLHHGKLKSTRYVDFCELTGLELCDESGCLKEDLPPIQRWLNRLLALPIAMQNAIFEEFLALVETRVEAAREAGTLDIGVETIVAEAARVIDDTLLRTDSRTGATSHLLTIEIARKRHVLPLARVLEWAESDPEAAFVRNTRSGAVAMRCWGQSWMDEEGQPIRRYELQRPCRREYLREADMFESAWELIDQASFEAGWEAEAAEAAAKLDVQTVQLATGLLLPIWSALPSDYLAVHRIVDKAGNSWLGRLVFKQDVVNLYTKLGIAKSEDLPASAIISAALSGRPTEITRPFPMSIKRARVNGNERIELVGAPAGQLPWFKSLGCWTELINFQTRLFVPMTDQANTILEAILALR